MNNGPTATTLTNNLIRLEGHEHNYDFQFRHYVEYLVGDARSYHLYPIAMQGLLPNRQRGREGGNPVELVRTVAVSGLCKELDDQRRAG
jgi:hypothetical protein